MARPADESAGISKVVELRAVQPGFPFYGQFTLQDGRPYRHSMLRDRGALVRPELLAQLGLKVGDEIVIGRSRFTDSRRHRASSPADRSAPSASVRA